MPQKGQRDWMQFGSCVGYGPELFYSYNLYEIEQAKRICQQCLVQTICLEYAITNKEEDGVWGGASERDRRKIVRLRRAARTNTS